jgi:two-component system chemotaxis sensor kinase CheA
VEVSAGKDVRFEAERWAPFWSAFIHVLRNALDHGVESPDQRLAAGKPAHGTLRLSMLIDGEHLTIDLSDDGRGVDWARVRAKAMDRGLPHASEQELINALFSDGLSTAETVSDVSGRGVGLSAVQQAAQHLKGSIQVLSTLGVGTTFRFRFPASEATRHNHQSRYPGARPSLLPRPTPPPKSGEVSVA